jgi:hypothetical protein
MSKRKVYQVHYERSEGHWTAVIDASQGVSCVTYGRSLSITRRRMQVVLKLALNDDVAFANAELKDNIILPMPMRKVVSKYAKARTRADRANKIVEAASSEIYYAARTLAEQGLSRRDTAEVLGLSHQRVQQLTYL